jgi:hypothetical protein
MIKVYCSDVQIFFLIRSLHSSVISLFINFIADTNLFIPFLLRMRFIYKTREESRIYVKCKIVLWDFVHRLDYKIIKLQRIGSWILLVEKRGRGQKTYLLGPLVELASDLDLFSFII